MTIGPGPFLLNQLTTRVVYNSSQKDDFKNRSLNSLRDALRMNTTNCVSEMANPCGRTDSAIHPTTVSTSSMLSTTDPFGCPRQSLIGVPSALRCASVITFDASHKCVP